MSINFSTGNFNAGSNNTSSSYAPAASAVWSPVGNATIVGSPITARVVQMPVGAIKRGRRI